MVNWSSNDDDERKPDRVTRGRLGGLTTSSRHNMAEFAARAHRGFLARFEREVDPDGVLPTVERERRAEAAKKLYFQRLGMKSAAVRRGQKGGGK